MNWNLRTYQYEATAPIVMNWLWPLFGQSCLFCCLPRHCSTALPSRSIRLKRSQSMSD
jgi:hypothetical protein